MGEQQGGADGFRAALANAPAPADSGGEPTVESGSEEVDNIAPGAAEEAAEELERDPETEELEDPAPVDEDAEEPSEEPEADDEPEEEPDPDPLDEEIHGAKARDILEAIRGGSIPDDLAAHIAVHPEQLVEVTIDGIKREVTAGEAAKGYMRQNAFTKRTQEAAEQTRKAESTVRGFQGTLQRWKQDQTGDTLFRGLRQFGMLDQAIAFANSLQEQMQQIGQLDEAHQAVAIENMRLRWGQEDAEYRRQQGLDEETRRARETKQETLQRALESHVPAALQEQGLDENNKLVSRLFGENLRAALADGGEVSEAKIYEAAKATREELEDLGYQARGGASETAELEGGEPSATAPGDNAESPARRQQAQARSSKALPPRGRQAPSPAPRRTPGGSKGGGRVSDFHNRMRNKFDVRGG